ncbi:PH and SEC7 domain-containing protein 2 [Cheilinus undulatus]|uniref:PH and SEC7 domain-containing protein 2 n=1 Tax=Cheilinus undulatus TaxID=241271 RepID=UPI001BD41AD1|nr:PH and SEC7 domain-containing protein 2 [Cheilinus undulatus]XP_041666931.1 PH and SEC7 domain-containing protein 2 [Cheilinus undulatus]XP_041666933.1 PH and SEC7 domain-containing protein 2 [Cheilinus undulatus]
MEEENLCSSLPDVTNAALLEPEQDSWTSIDRQYINGEQEGIVWDETEVLINQEHKTDQLSLSPKAEKHSLDEAEPWEQIIWPVRPMTCTSPLLSFATVQWDMPDSSVETPSLVTHSSLANELDCLNMMSVSTISPSPHPSEDFNEEPFREEGREEEEKFDSELLNSEIELNGNNVEPCDAADVQKPTTQEGEDSTQELSGSNTESIPEISLETALTEDEEIEEQSDGSDPAASLDLIDTPEEIEGSGDEADSFVDLQLEEEEEKPVVLLTRQGDVEEEQTSAISVEAEEEDEKGGEAEEEEGVMVPCCTEQSEEAEAVCHLNHTEIPAEFLQTDETESSINHNQLLDLQQSELLEETTQSRVEEDIQEEGPKGQGEEPEMCEDVDQSLEPEQSEVANNIEELSIQSAENAEGLKDSPEILELTEKLQETSGLEHQDSEEAASQDVQTSLQPEHAEPEQVDMTEVKEQSLVDSEDQLKQHLEQPKIELEEEDSTQTEKADLPEELTLSEQTVSVEAEDPGAAEQQEQTEPLEQNEQQAADEQLVQKTDESEITEQTEVTQQTEEAEFTQEDKQAGTSHQAEEEEGAEDENVHTVISNGVHPKPHMNGGEVDREAAKCLAERLFKLEEIQRVEVVKHLDKDNDFSRAVGEEYLKFFDFTGQTLDHALRSFLKVVVLIGETQERERVLQHFACRFHECNPDSFSFPGPALALTCAMMLLNTDLHGQNVGKPMSSSKFVSNLDGMNEGENFSKDLLKSLYNSIKNEPLEWAIDEEELKSSVLVDEDAEEDVQLRSKANPFQNVPHNKRAIIVKQGFLQRKILADIDGKRTPWGKRGWKTYFGVLRGMVLYLQKDDYRKDQMTNEEVVSVHHSLAEPAADYTKKPHVFRLQTADWRVFLFQASSKAEMNSWISRINLVCALHSSPPFPAAVGSQRRFCRPILPASQSAHTLESQLQFHAKMLESFKADLSHQQQNIPDGKKAKTKELEEHRVRAEYLQHEIGRYEIYIQVLEAWKKERKVDDNMLRTAELSQFDKAMCADSVMEGEEEDDSLKRSHSSPSLELEMPAEPQAVIKVRRNISERRTYRRTIIPRWNKES